MRLVSLVADAPSTATIELNRYLGGTGSFFISLLFLISFQVRDIVISTEYSVQVCNICMNWQISIHILRTLESSNIMQLGGGCHSAGTGASLLLWASSECVARVVR
ncbi:hypothetical protein IF1G_05984 [Cordyceps javanica]|uniref:Uncharacterized protein n=1 Tax=Cordyceps javanica TaxID=43265 RepID=A0A545UZX3_9HYPO|nr:hypothetical protein IF1G_05984 [Cordyceps javanica]